MFFFPVPRWSVCVLDVFILVLVRVRTKRYLKVFHSRLFSSFFFFFFFFFCCQLCHSLHFPSISSDATPTWYAELVYKYKHWEKNRQQRRKITNISVRKRANERVKGTRLADTENSTQYSFYNGKKHEQKPLQMATIHAEIKLLFPWNADSSHSCCCCFFSCCVVCYFPIFPSSSFFLFFFVRLFCFITILLFPIYWMPNQNVKQSDVCVSFYLFLFGSLVEQHKRNNFIAR